ncbi:hypothetical protein SNOG_10239 [Parastagonospora nodorum SN15]|uniref:CorA-like transporter domain-containing protein n=1 Tax=Phaeosphaeria nodorum (strain SN15 / ATCC MYA-4574 / FGSC 10173) TaxID=321614 RepID=Q0UDC5_PHANO|nr:hypothetical protein SNOG_10239 [Parastagonospora nodorum SN15]EAT82574.1 hypothetical protein SNOG_10239 [Parastagonospora nodorum SN15]
MDPMDFLATNSLSFWTRFENSTKCFELDSSLTESVHIIDTIAAQRPQSTTAISKTQECANFGELKSYLSNGSNLNYSSRLISISQKNSWSRLQITKPMLRELMEHHEVHPTFLEVPLSFSYRDTDEEQSFCVPWTVREDENSIQVFYTFRYAEYKGHPNEPWVIRQAGVYQRFDIHKKSSLYVLVNASPQSAAYCRALECFSKYEHQMQLDPLWLHGVIHASYFMYWREYIAEYEKRLLPIADMTTSTMISEPLRLQMESRLDNARRYTRTFIRTALFLQERSNNTATLLADTLAFRNQGVAQEQNGSMVVLTRSAVFITVITLIYLPWTLVTGIFGMEFFELDLKTNRLITSPQIWIYFVTAMVTTMFTVVLYYGMAGLPNLRKLGAGFYGKSEDEDLPQSIRRSSTDVEKSPRLLAS